jgi:twitching motility protein PilT
MRISPLIAAAKAAGASDLHLEGGLPACLRVRGTLRSVGQPLAPRELTEMARELLGDERWPELLERRSADLALSIDGARCRINLLCTSRGVGLAVRFLSSAMVSLERLNLHPELARLVEARHGLVLVCGPTGSGKSSTLAALVQELNAREKLHLLTLEAPIEFVLRPQHCFIRQREVGRDTPSFEQGLYDALREDPDVLMVGELRDAETMRLALSAAETGHLVLTTLHSATCAEGLQRLVSAFAPEIQPSICAQLADCLVGVVAQRLRWLPEKGLRAAECEVLTGTQNVRAIVRQGAFGKLQSALETGAADGMFTFARYRDWLERRADFFRPDSPPPAEPDAEPPPSPLPPSPLPPSPRAADKRAADKSITERRRAAPTKSITGAPDRPPAQTDEGVLEIQEGDEDLAAILSKLERG